MQLTVRGRWEGQYYIGLQFHSQGKVGKVLPFQHPI